MLIEAVTNTKPIDRYKILENKLNDMGRDISSYRNKTADVIRTSIRSLEKRIHESRFKSGFMDFLKEDQYVQDLYTRDALSCLLEFKEDRDESIVLIPGMTYYCAELKENTVSGKRCYYISEDNAFWSDFKQDQRIMKAVEVLQWGNDDQFRKIYFEMADGRPFESTEEMMFEHITESSDEALDNIATFCDTLWEGKWPWETMAPTKLRSVVKENTHMTMKSVQEFRNEFSSIVTKLNEGEIERSAVITKMNGYIEDIDNMLEKLGRVSGNLLTDVRETVRSEFGDDAANNIENLVQQHIKGAADELSSLKNSWSENLDKMLDNSGPEEAPEFDDEFGGMDDEMEPGMDGEADAIDSELEIDDDEADLNFDDEDDGEREKK